MRIALIQPDSPFLIQQNVHPPLGLMYLSAVLKDAGHEVLYADLGLGDAIPDDADVYYLTGTTPQLGAMVRIVADLYAERKPIVVGGPQATVDPQPLLDAGATAVVQGEGEYTPPELFQFPTWHSGIIVRAERIQDLDALPFPDRSEASRYHYTITDKQGNRLAATTMITSRGCPHRCAFCAHSVWGQLVRLRSAENVIAEIKHLRDLGWAAVHIFDDTACVSSRRLLHICEGIAGLGMVWRCFVRSDEIDRDMLSVMAKAGCVEIGIGLESGSQRVLNAINKGETVEQQRAAILAAKAVGLRVKCFVICGLPGEDWRSVDETVAFLEETRPDDIDVSVLSVLPGSPIAANPAAYGIELTGQPVFYKGKPGEYTASHRTKALSTDDIVAARNYVEARCKPKWT